MDKLFYNIKNNIPEPDQAWLNQTRDFVLSKYESKYTQSQNSGLKSWWYHFVDNFSVTRQLALKPIAITAVLLAIIFGGPLSIVVASQDALPGDSLYLVKKTTKSFKKYLTVTKLQQAKQEIAFVGGSVADLTQTVNKTELVKNNTEDEKNLNNIKLAVEVVKKDVEDLQKKLETRTNNNQYAKHKDQTIALARLVTQQKIHINRELSATKQKLTNSTQAGVVQTIEEVEAKLAQAGRVAVKVLAQEHAEDQMQNVIPTKELASLVESEISDTKNRIITLDLDKEEDISDNLKGLIEEQTANVKDKLADAEELADNGKFYMAMLTVEEASQKIETVKDIIKKVVDLSEDKQPDSTEQNVDYQVAADPLADQDSIATSTEEDFGEIKGETTVSEDQVENIEEDQMSPIEYGPLGVDKNMPEVQPTNVNDSTQTPQSILNNNEEPIQVEEDEYADQEYQIKIGE